MREPLVTDRLVLRDITEADAEPLFDLDSDPEVMRYLGGPRSAERCETELADISKQYADIGYGMLAVERREDGAFLGICGLSVEQWYPNDLQIGWRLFQRYWGHGYAREAALVWRDHAFSRDVDRLISISDVPNIRSHRLMQRIGLSYDHETFDAHIYALSRQDWLSLGKL